MNRVVAHWALLPSYQDHFRTEFRTEVNFSQKLQPSVDTKHNTRERANRKHFFPPLWNRQATRIDTSTRGMMFMSSKSPALPFATYQ